MIRRSPKFFARNGARTAWFGLGFLALGLVTPDAFGTTENENPYAMLDQLGRVLAWVETEYVDPVDRVRLTEGAIEGMVASLDPHSAYLRPADYAIFQDDTQGRFGGVGVEVDFTGDWVTVIAPIEGSPAERAGIQPGDRIVAIDHLGVREESPAELVRRMRGAPGSEVLLGVLRGETGKVLYFRLKREIIQVSSVASELLAQGVGYLRIKSFQSGTHTELLQGIAELRRRAGGAPRGILLDLRNNPGGLVDEATAVADEFLSSGIIFTTRHRGRIVDELSARPGGALRDGVVVVLVNEYTASSAELLSGALQDNRRATVVGAPTFGKGSVQSIVDLPGGAGLRLTTLRYYTPSGRTIQAQGVTPDVNVPSPTESFGAIREKNLTEHLPPEQGAPSETPPPELGQEPPRSDPALDPLARRRVPFDPLTGDDPVLAVAYRMLLEGQRGPARAPVPAPRRTR